MEVIDAFCGAGGFSAGAMAAGCRVTMGVDSDPVPLKLWAANTGGRAVCATIGRDAVEWPEARSGLHVHLSPACTHLSKARAGSASPGEVEGALRMAPDSEDGPKIESTEITALFGAGLITRDEARAMLSKTLGLGNALEAL